MSRKWKKKQNLLEKLYKLQRKDNKYILDLLNLPLKMV